MVEKKTISVKKNSFEFINIINVEPYLSSAY